MPDSRFNVDDILRELEEKQEQRPQQYGNQIYNQQPPPPPRRPAPPVDDSWEPVGSRAARETAPPPQRTQPRPSPTREIPMPRQEARLGQQPARPKTREEMGRLINNFSETDEDPLGDLGFLENRPSRDDDFFGEPPQRQQSQQLEQPRQPRQQQPPPPPPPPQQFEQPRQQPRAQQPAPLAQEQFRRARPEVQRPVAGARDLYGGSIMQRNDRRSMADAAKMLTSGGLDDFPDEQTQARAPRSRQPMQQPPRPVNTAPPSHVSPVPQSQPRPRSMQGMPMQPAAGQDRFDNLDSLDSDSFGTRQRTAPPPTTATPRNSGQYSTRQVRPAPEPSIFGDEQDEPQPQPQPQQERRDEPRAAPSTMQQLSDQLTAMRTGLLVRVTVNLLSLVTVIYLALAGSYDFPLPSFLTGSDNATLVIWMSVATIAVSALVSGNTIGGGVLALLKLRPSNDSYTAIAVFACLIQGSYVAMQPSLVAGDNLYLPLAALMLLFNTLGKLIMMSRIAGSFALLSAKGQRHIADIMDNREFARRIASEIIGDEPAIIYSAQTASVENFLEQAFSDSKAEDISRIVAPLTALAALVMALLAYVFNRDIFTSASVYTAALCITAPLAGTIACHLPLSITNGKLARWGASLCGYDAVDQIADVNGAVLRASQIFPKGSVAIQDIQVLDRRPIDQIILDAASVLCSCDSYLAPVFTEMIQNRSMIGEAENHEFYDGMGLSAWVNGRRILIGNRNLMLSYGVSVPDAEYERQYTAGGGEALYLASSGEASAIYLIAYRPDKNMRRCMQLICDSDMGVCVYSNDPTLTTDRISSTYSFPRELITIIPSTMHAGTEKYLRPSQRATATAIHNGSPASFLRMVMAARSCSRCITWQTAILLMSVVLGFAIVTFFAFTGNMGALTWITITVYQFFWVLLELAVPLFKH